MAIKRVCTVTLHTFADEYLAHCMHFRRGKDLLILLHVPSRVAVVVLLLVLQPCGGAGGCILTWATHRSGITEAGHTLHLHISRES